VYIKGITAADDSQIRPVAQAELDAWGHYLRAEGKRPATVSSYLSVVGKLLRAYPDKKFSEFTHEDIVRYLEAGDERHRGQFASMIRGWFRWGELTEQIIDVRNPTRRLPKYKWARSGAVRELFSDAEMSRLKGLPHPDGVLMEILLETGIKTGEARTLTGKCCELDVPQLRLVESAAPRRIPITDPAFKDRLARMLQVEKIGLEGYLWYSHPGGSRERRHSRAISSGAMNGWWSRCAEAAGVPHRMMRTTRNTFARRMINDGVPLDDLTLWLGHNDYYTTSEYYADGRYADALQRVVSMKDATAVIRRQQDLLQRVLPHLLTHGAPGSVELAKEISAQLTEQA
jgi:integrase